MFVCQCNAFTDKFVERLVNEGAKDILDVHKKAGEESGGDKSPRCGTCVEKNQEVFFPDNPSPRVERYVARIKASQEIHDCATRR